jgi:PAS domain S-box-containing protein
VTEIGSRLLDRYCQLLVGYAPHASEKDALAAYEGRPEVSEKGALRAYELGREALAAGLGLLDMGAIHMEALSALLAETRPSRRTTELLSAATQLFEEALSPFEMAYRGYAQANATLQDLTEQLKSTEHYTRSLVESNIDALIVTDTAGIIIDVNQQMCKMTGRSREQLVGSPIKTHFTDAAAADHGIRMTLLEGKLTNYELTARAADGRETAVSHSATTFYDPVGNLRGVVVAARDVTELKRLETRANSAQRLESLGLLAGGIAHDFNNLLAVIINYADFLGEAMGQDSPLRPDLDQIRRAAERAAALTHQLLIFGRRQVVKPQILELNAVVSETEKMLQRTIGEQIEFRSALDEDLWRVNADPSQVEQVLMNLVMNARDAMPNGGLLKVETSNKSLDETYLRGLPDVKPGRFICLSVSDTGVGMEAETMRRAFEPFFTTKARDTGAGLGLTTVYGIVKQAGGHVSLYSEPQMGTTVRVYLPASDEMLPAADRAVAAEPLDGQQRTVLLVEDEDAVRELTERILGRHGYRVIEAAGPVQAVELYQRRGQSIDLLLTDVIMPQMNGRALAERIRQQQPGIRVLYMSGYPGDLIAFHGELAEGVDLLQKPFTEESLLRAAQRVLMGSKATPPSQIEGGGREAA